MRSAPRPVAGAVLGAALGLALVLLLWQLAVAPPDRLPLLGVPALVAAAGATLASPRRARQGRSFLVVMALACALSLGALTGIPEFVRGGSVTDGCSAQLATASTRMTPAETSASEPLELPRDGTLSWRIAAPQPSQNGASGLGLRIGGADVRLWNGGSEERRVVRGRDNHLELGPFLSGLESGSGLALSGVYHVSAVVEGEGAPCHVRAYVALAPQHPFHGPVLVTLWVVVLALAGALTALTVAVRCGPRGETPR